MSRPAEGALADGLDEARRGLWRSAAESFAAAAAADGEEPGARLAEAVCRLHLGEAAAAMVLLETAGGPAFEASPWAQRRAWLVVAARLAAGDPLGAERAAEALEGRLRARALAHVRMATGEVRGGVAALLFAYGRG